MACRDSIPEIFIPSVSSHQSSTLASNPLVRLEKEKVTASQTDLDQLSQAFAHYDADKDGVLSRSEVLSLLRKLGVKEADLQERVEFNRADNEDQDNDGALTFDEVYKLYRLLQEGCNDPSEPESLPDADSFVSDVYSQRNVRSPTRVRGILDLARQREEDKKAEEFMTERKKEALQRIYDLMYNLPAFAPDYVYRRWWDVIILLVILYHWVVAPVQGIFGPVPTNEILAIECFLSVVLMLDVAITMNTAVQAEDRSFTLVVDRCKIFHFYVRSGRFAIDFLSGFPFDLLMWYVSGLTGWRICRFLRILKLFKVFFLFIQTDRGNMDPPYVQFYFWTVPLINIFAKMVFFGNLLTVGRMIIASYPEPEPECSADHDFGLDTCTNNIVHRYLLSFWWCWALLTTQGLAKIESGVVYAYAGFVMLMSLLLQGHVVANMSALLMKADVQELHRDRMRSTLAIMRQYCIPTSLQQEVLSFQFHSLQQNAASGFAHVLERLPGPMQKEVGLYVRIDLINKVPMFEQLSTGCKLELANCLEQTFCEPDCYIIEFGERGDEMYFLMHGFADVIIPQPGSMESGRVITTVKRGDFFGEMALLNPELKRRASIQALTYCDMFQLHNDDFRKMLTNYQELREKVEAEAERRGLNNTNDMQEETPAHMATSNVISRDSTSTFVDQKILGRSSVGSVVGLHPPTTSEVQNLMHGKGVDNLYGLSRSQVAAFQATRSFRKIREAAHTRRTSVQAVDPISPTSHVHSALEERPSLEVESDTSRSSFSSVSDTHRQNGTLERMEKQIRKLVGDNRKLTWAMQRVEKQLMKLQFRDEDKDGYVAFRQAAHLKHAF